MASASRSQPSMDIRRSPLKMVFETTDNSSFQPDTWNSGLAELPGAHILQTGEWGQVKAKFGWRIRPITWRDQRNQIMAAALTLEKKAPFPVLSRTMGIIYVPKGPLLDWSNEELRRQVLDDLSYFGRQRHAIFVKIDPDVRVGTGVPGTASSKSDPLGAAVTEDLDRLGWRYSNEQVQFRNTVLLDLTPDLEQILRNMRQKTRYNVRLAKRKGVEVRVGNADDLHELYRIYAETSVRDGFAIREQDYYLTVWTNFMESGIAEPLVALVSGNIVAGLVLFRFAEKAWFLYGMSSAKHREKMPNYLLQWEAIRWAKSHGCRVYDLWGAPDEFIEADPMWGVFRFKEGLGGEVVRHIGAWDLTIRPTLFYLYTRILPRILDLMRWRGKIRSSSMIN